VTSGRTGTSPRHRSRPVVIDPDRPAAIVVHCSDPRYQPHFQDFLHGGLKLDRYALIAVPGGPQCLVLAGYQPKFSWAGWRWMKFMKSIAKPARIVLIAHDDCRWYIENRYVPHASEAREHQIKDMRQACAELGERFGKVSIELFYATLDGDTAQFEEL
jgi:hypothetical protein